MVLEENGEDKMARETNEKVLGRKIMLNNVLRRKIQLDRSYSEKKLPPS